MLLSCRLSKSKLLAITTGFASAFLFITDANAQRIDRPGQGAEYRQIENQGGFLAQGDRDLPRGDGHMYNVQSGMPGQGLNNPGSMSGRFRKYVNGGGEQGDEPTAGRRPLEGRLQNLSEEQRQMLKGKMQSMSKEERMQFIQQMRQRRGGQFGGQGQGPGRMRRPGQGGGDGGMQQQQQQQPPRTRGGDPSRGAVRQWAGRKPLDLGPLNLTEKQKEKIQAMRQTNSSQARQINKEMRSKRARIKEMLFDPTATSESIIKEQAEYSSLRNQADKVMVNDFLGIRSVLSKEQLQMLPQLRPGRSRSGAPMVGGASGNVHKRGQKRQKGSAL